MDTTARIKAAIYMELVDAQCNANNARDEGTLERAIARVEAKAIERVLKAIASAEKETQIGVYFQADSIEKAEEAEKGRRRPYAKQVGLIAVPWEIGQFDYRGPYPMRFRIETYVRDQEPGTKPTSIGFCVRTEDLERGVTYVVEPGRAFLGGLVDPKDVGTRLTQRLRCDLGDP